MGLTPSGLLARAKDFFPVLYHNEPDKLRNLVRETIGVFHENAGLILRCTSPADDLTDTDIDLPSDFGSAAMLRDARGQYHEFTISDGVLSPVLQDLSEAPFTLEYFCDLRGFDVALSLEDYDADAQQYAAGDSAVRNSAGEEFICVQTHDPTGKTEPQTESYDETLWKPYNQLPVECTGILLDYLTASIDLHNTERARGVNASVGIQEDLPSRSELMEKITAVRTRMSESFFVLPVCSVTGYGY